MPCPIGDTCGTPIETTDPADLPAAVQQHLADDHRLSPVQIAQLSAPSADPDRPVHGWHIALAVLLTVALWAAGYGALQLIR